jgi:N utilization substance protein B
LRILYQKDVGKSTLPEALTSAMERLRLEFVQRGSRTASGSTAEQICLDYLTRVFSDLLPLLNPALEQTIREVVSRLLTEPPYWQELRFEKAFRTAMPGVPLVPARLLTQLSDRELLPGGPQDQGLSPAERETISELIARSREELSQLLDPEMRQNARLFARELAQDRPIGADPDLVQQFLLDRRKRYNLAQAERWHKIGVVVQKQLGDWLRTAGFTVRLATGAEERKPEIDAAIEDLSAGWRLERQVTVDRNILRLAGFEILFMPGVPAGVAINEAVELAKKYSTAESGRFVNGVLGALASRIGDRRTVASSADPLEVDYQDEPLDLPDITAIEDTDSE